MDRIKKINYLREKPDGAFPDVEQVAPEEARQLRARIATLVDAEESPDSHHLVAAVRATSAVLGGYDANAAGFSIREILKERGIDSSAKVYVNWSRFERMDRMFLNDLDDFFSYIWYPASDDIEVFDAGLQWLLSVTHDGSVMILIRDNTRTNGLPEKQDQ